MNTEMDGNIGYPDPFQIGLIGSRVLFNIVAGESKEMFNYTIIIILLLLHKGRVGGDHWINKGQVESCHREHM